jgi:hypothetical protein
MSTVTIDALDAIKLAEILEHLLDHVALLTEHNTSSRLFAHCSPYGLDDLQANITRSNHRLNTGPIDPLTRHRSIDLLGRRRPKQCLLERAASSGGGASRSRG